MPHRPARIGLRSLERLLALAGIACLAWVYGTWQLSAWYQAHAKREMAQLAETRRAPATHPPLDRGLIPRDESLIGVLDVPRLDFSVAVLDGDDAGSLSLGVGHLPDTPLPWEGGNSAFAGHRDTFFRPLRDLRVGDELRLTTRHGDFAYRVRHLAIVGPHDLEVLAPSADARLTLITCYPFTYVGSAPQRFVVLAERVGGGETAAR